MIWELISNQMPHKIHYLKKKKRNDHRNKIKILLIIIIFCWESSWSNIQQCSNAMIKNNCPHSSYTSKHYKTEKYHKTDEVPLQKTKKWSKNKLSFDFNEKTDIKSSIKMWMQWDIRKIISVAVWSENMKKRTLSKIRKAVGKVPAIQMSFW